MADFKEALRWAALKSLIAIFLFIVHHMYFFIKCTTF